MTNTERNMGNFIWGPTRLSIPYIKQLEWRLPLEEGVTLGQAAVFCWGQVPGRLSWALPTSNPPCTSSEGSKVLWSQEGGAGWCTMAPSADDVCINIINLQNVWELSIQKTIKDYWKKSKKGSIPGKIYHGYKLKTQDHKDVKSPQFYL